MSENERTAPVDAEVEALRRALERFQGREQTYYSFPIDSGIYFTEGARYLALQAEALWLLADIAFAQDVTPRLGALRFQVWKLDVRADRSALLTAEDGNGVKLYRRQYDSTSFLLPEITLFFSSNVIYLPSEH